MSDRVEEGGHAWASIQGRCDLEDPNDPLILAVTALFRDAYGEKLIMDLAADPGVEALFDLGAIQRAVRMGLPDPGVEGNKPPHLANYRSETVEVLARGALAHAHNVEFPTSPQLGKTNANMPILGFDGWGVLRVEGGFKLVLVQAKGTADDAVPPGEARNLWDECERMPRELSKLARALSILVTFLQDTEYLAPVLAMLEALGRDELPPLVVAPVIVRGEIPATLDDLTPIRERIGDLAPCCALGLAMSVGIDLTAFGRRITEEARAA